MMTRLTPCHVPATSMTRVPVMAIALGPLVLLKSAPARNPERRGDAGSLIGVHASMPLFRQYSRTIK